MGITIADWVGTTSLGALVGIGELVSRYRDEPSHALRTLPAVLYILLNALASAAALTVVNETGWTLGGTPESFIHWGRILVAGFGAMALFRSSFFSIRIHDQDVGVGPSSILHIILSAADRAVDRLRARARVRAVCRAMADIYFDKAHQALPALCFGLMQNLPKEEQEQVAHQVATIKSADMDEYMKGLLLGLVLMNMVGEDVLIAAVNSLGPEYKKVKDEGEARLKPIL